MYLFLSDSINNIIKMVVCIARVSFQASRGTFIVYIHGKMDGVDNSLSVFGVDNSLSVSGVSSCQLRYI